MLSNFDVTEIFRMGFIECGAKKLEAETFKHSLKQSARDLKCSTKNACLFVENWATHQSDLQGEPILNFSLIETLAA